MRLICPNCDAQYEVPLEVMPPDGRDVQCSNCGQTWFQEHPDYPSEDIEDATPDTEEADELAEVEPAGLGSTEFQSRSFTEDELIDEDATEADSAENSNDEEPEIPGRRELDPSVADVLRAEAELEAQARRNDNNGMETQPELGLPEVSDDSTRRAREARDRMAKMRGEYIDEDEDAQEELLAATSSVMGSRRDLLPDIEEINSTLRSNNDRSPTVDSGQTAQIEEQEKRSSRLGFTLTIALIAVLVLFYVLAPNVAEKLPQAAPALDAYVSTVNGLRGWLDTQITAALGWLDDAAVSSGQ